MSTVDDLLSFVSTHQRDVITGELLEHFLTLQRRVAIAARSAGLELPAAPTPAALVAIGATRCPMVDDRDLSNAARYLFPDELDVNWLSWLHLLRDIGEPATQDNASQSDAIRALLSLFSGGVADGRFDAAAGVVNDPALTADDKLRRIDELMPFPPTASAERLGKLLGVSKAAIQNTSWYIKNRKGQRDIDIETRRRKHEQRRE